MYKGMVPMQMSQLEKRLAVAALVFVAIYLGAIGLTLTSRLSEAPQEMRYEATGPAPGESHLILAELFLPMMILLAVAVGFVVAKKKRAKAELLLDESDDDMPDVPAGNDHGNEMERPSRP